MKNIDMQFKSLLIHVSKYIEINYKPEVYEYSIKQCSDSIVNYSREISKDQISVKEEEHEFSYEQSSDSKAKYSREISRNQISYNISDENTLFDDNLFSEDAYRTSKLKDLDKQLKDTWQQSLFNHIDKKEYNDPEVYKRASISKQTFSKIRSDEHYQPNKDTAIQLCIGLKLNLDETIDLLAKAGFTLSQSIKRDLVIKYFIEEQIYDIEELNMVLHFFKMKLFPIN